MNTTVNFMIRAQAQNGMLLGPDSYNGAIISIRNAATRELLAEGLMNTGNSGSRTGSFFAWTSPYPIVTPTTPDRTTYFVEADATSVGYAVTLPITKPTILEISAHVPLTVGQERPTATITQQVAPGEDFSQGIGLVIPIPGLWVQPELVTVGNLLRVRAKVTMMCGCMINTDATTPHSPWLPTDFVVSAQVTAVGEEEESLGSFPMTFLVNSQFFADVPLPISNGSYRITITAKQMSSGLVGMATAYL
jgi:hypothetical protein